MMSSFTRDTLRILLVDDSIDDRAEARSVLRAGSTRRYEFSEVHSGKAALQAIQSAAIPFDCAVVDFHLSDVTAVEFIRSVRSDESARQAAEALPIVVLTGSAGAEVNRQVLRVGAQDFVGKDWLTPESLTRAVENAIERQAMSRELIERDQALRASERRLRQVIDSVDVLIAMLSTDGRLIEANDLPFALTRTRRDDWIGKPIWEIDWWSDEAGLRDRFADAVSQAANGEIAHINATVRAASDFSPHLDVTFRPVRGDDSEILFIVVSGVDVTKRRLAEQERERLLDSERAARTDAEHANRLKDEFLATLSHELRTPLNAILGWAQMLRIGKLTGDSVRKGLETIERSAKVQAQLIEDLLDMSRILSGKLRLDVQLISLADVVDAAVATVLPTAEAKGVILTRTVELHRGLVRGDAGRLQQVVWNLLANAVKFTPRDGRVEVRLSRSNGEWIVEVRDTGQGIAAPFLSHVFERFRQADASTTRQHGGLGLGLAIVKHLAESHGGRVSVASEGVGKGATFSVHLPVAERADSSPATPSERQRVLTDGDEGAAIDAAARLSMSLIDLAGLRLLVVDDDADAREVATRVLQEGGAEVENAASVEEAMAKLDQPFDVLVCDIGMPGRDGYTLIRWLREREAGTGRHMPVIAMTAFARAEDRLKTLREGFNFHLVKPVQPTELCGVVANLAGRFQD